MSGVYVKRSLSSLLVQACLTGSRHHLVGSNGKFTLFVNNLSHIRHFPKMKPLSFGLLAGCCFSKQEEGCDSDRILPGPPEGIPGRACYDDLSEGLLNRTTEYGSLHSSTNSAKKEIIDHCAGTSHSDDARSGSHVSSKELVADDTRLCNIDSSTTSIFVVPNVNAICALDDVKATVPVKRSSSEVVSCCKPKYQKLDEERKELCSESCVDQSILSGTNHSDTCDVAKGALPEADCEISRNEEIRDVTKDKGASSKNSQKKTKQRPNYFVSMRISNPVIHKSLEAVQAHITEQDSRLKPSLVSLEKLHITLMVIYLGSAEEHEKALGVLNRLYEGLNEDVCKCPLTLEFTGLGSFNNKVLFAKVKPGDSLDRLNNIAKDVVEHFKEASIIPTDSRFTPHLTVMKLSQAPKLYHQGIKKIDPSLYSMYKDHVFGSEVIKGIELLSMQEPKDASGYYRGHQLLFGDTQMPTLAAPSVSLTEEIQDKKHKISQLAQAQLERMVSSPSDKNAPADSSSSSDVK